MYSSSSNLRRLTRRLSMLHRLTDLANRDKVEEFLEKVPKETQSPRGLCILILRESCKVQRKKTRRIIN